MPQNPQNLPPEAQQMIGELQQSQQQLQQMEQHKMELRAQKSQIDKAVEALKETGEDEEVFRVVGPTVIKSNRNDLLEDLEEKQETL